MRNLIILFLLVLVLRIGFAFLFQFDGLYGQDPFAYFDYTQELRQVFVTGETPPPFFWPIGYPLLAVLGSLFAGLGPLAGQAISILAGSLIALFVYLIVLEIEPQAYLGGFVAGLLTGTAAQLMLSSLSYMADAAALAWATLAALAMLRHCRTLRSRWLLLAAFALGWAVLTRWAYALVALPLALAALLAWKQQKLLWSKRLILIGSAVLISSIIISSQFLLTLGQGQSSFVGNLEVTSWNPTNALKTTVTYGDGTFTYERPVGVFYAMPILHPAFIFPLLTPFLLLALWSFRKRPSHQIAVLLGWPLIFYLFLIGTWENPRFSLAFFPPLTVLVGLGLHSLSKAQLRFTNYLSTNDSNHRSKGPNQKRHSQFIIHYSKPLLILYLTLALLGSLAWAGRDLRNFTAINNTQITAAHWVESQVPPDATVITFGVTLTMQHRTELSVSEIYHLNPESLAQLVENQAPLYLFLDLDNINSQWQDLSPQQNYHWLEENGRLTEIAYHPPYTLFQVSAVP